MSNIVLGNIVALIASIIMVCSGLIKDKKRMLFTQTIQVGLSVLSNIILGGITGAIINALGVIRNILCYKNKLDLKAKIILIFFSVSLSLMFNNLGIIGLFPVFSIVSCILFMNTKNIIKYKLLIMFTMIMWCIYDIYIKSYTSAVFDFMTIISNMISIIQIKYLRKGMVRK